MRQRRIWSVYYGTRGTAGSYIDSLQKASLKAGIHSLAFVSARYRFGTKKVVKIFFPLTDHTEKRNLFIKALRYFELALGYGFLSCGAALFRPAVNLNLIDDLALTHYFFLFLKFIGLKVFVTCHDVLSYHKGMTRKRQKMYEKADKLIVHSIYAFEVLSGILGEKHREKIIKFPFPFSSFEEILSPSRMLAAKKKLAQLVGQNNRYFLFIGIVRESKGIDTLLEAWALAKAGSRYRLIIAGKWTAQANHLKKKAEELPNCLLIDRYLNDEEFVFLIRNSRFVILPYKDYSHSAVLYASAWNGGAVIISDIDLFVDILPGYELIFSQGDSEKLAGLIDRTANFTDQNLEHYKKILLASVQRESLFLEKEIKKAFLEL